RTSNTTRCLNLGSYNYLGFAAADEYYTPRVIESLKKYSASTYSVRVDGGMTKFHNELEELPARFVGKPAAILFGMGYVTNSAIIPCLIGKGGLIISDSLNYNSIVNGARGSGATVRVFQHNCAQKLAHIRENSNFFRSELKKMVFEVLGDNDSPVMPIMLYNPAKIPAFSRECLRQKVAVVTVAFPATPLLARARICISTSHTREDLIKALDVISRVGDLVGIKYFPVEPPKIAGADHDKLE
ncbi:Long chain base biosynthesis protein 2a, partial [Zea mays]